MIRNQCDIPTEDVEGEAASYICLVCAGQRYHLVFRVGAISHQASLIFECDSCRFRQAIACE